MNFNRAKQVCPYLLGSSEGVMCSGAMDFIRNIHDVDLELCMSRHFESCHVYFTKLKELNELLASHNESSNFYENISKYL
jgi:hypothetical protein